MRKNSTFEKEIQDFAKDNGSCNTDHRSSWNCTGLFLPFDEWVKEHNCKASHPYSRLEHENMSKQLGLWRFRALSYAEFMEVWRRPMANKNRCYVSGVPDGMDSSKISRSDLQVGSFELTKCRGVLPS